MDPKWLTHVKRMLLILGIIGIVGLLPIWVAVVWVVAGAMQHQGSMDNYWAVAPWLIVAGVTASPITMISALGAIYIFRKSDGGPLRKFILAALTYVGGIALMFAVLGVIND